MKRLLPFFGALCLSIISAAQNVWIFGSDIGIDFNTNPPTTIIPPPSIFGGAGGGSPYNVAQLGCATITDASGQLLFYTANKDLYNRNFYQMPNGDNSIFHSATEGVVIVPMPGNANKYYVFTVNTQLDDFSNPNNKGMMYYNIVDMTLDGGMGDIEPGKKLIPVDSFLTGKVTAVVGDKCNVWVVARSRNSNEWKAYEITPQGLNLNPVVSVCGNLSDYLAIPAYNGGQLNLSYLDGVIRFSPDRQKLACACIGRIIGSNRKGLELYDFDPATGVVSNPLTIDTLISYYGTCFSPDGSKLYGGQQGGIGIYQWDLSLPNTAAIIASKFLVGNVNLTPNALVKTDLKAAPDGKIYMSRPGGTPYIARFMHTISQPNLAGSACQFLFNGYQLVPAGYNILTAGMMPRAALPNEVAVYVHDTSQDNLNLDTVLCWSPSLQITADTNGWDYVWTDSAIGPVRTVTESGTYIVTYMKAPCTFHADTFHVTLNNQVPELLKSRLNCSANGEIIYVQPVPGDTIAYAYTWLDTAGNILQTQTYGIHGDTLANMPPGTYSVRVSSRSGCDTLLTATLYGSIEASFTHPPGACEGYTVNFQNTSTGTGSFLWSFGDGNTAVTVSPSHVYAVPGTYRVMLVMTDTTLPCRDTAYGTIVVDTLPYVSFIMQPDSICEGLAVSFEVTYRSGVRQLLWDFSDGAETDLSGVRKFMHAFDTSGLMVIKATGYYPNCPDTSFSDTIMVWPYPVVNIGPDTFLCPNGQPILLYDREPFAAGNRYQWNTGDTTSSILARHHARYTLSVTSGHDCAGSDSADVFKSCYIDIPNVFTPNGDGLNDYFLPRELLSHALTSFHMQIYNRWGEMIFETSRVDGRGWDGDYNGLAQPQGVYVYLIQAGFENGAEESYQGNVTLIR